MARCHRQYVADRFIPVRSAMDFGISSCLLRDTKRDPEKEAVRAASPAAEAYRMLLAETLMINRRILTFGSKPSADDSAAALKPSKRRRYIPQSPDDLMEAPGIVDDYCLNLLDWGSSNVIAIALGDTVFLWDASNRTTRELVTVDEGDVITSLSWAPDGRHIAVGCNSSLVHIWDAGADRHLRTLRCGHRFAVGSLAWNNSILTMGGLDGLIVNNDVRVKSRAVNRYQGHQQEVCTLKWSGSGQLLASGGNDNLLCIWDQASASSSVRWLHKFEDHRAAVRALAWCPFQNNVLASGGGDGDHSIKFWDTRIGACLSSIDTGSQVCSLLWSKKEREFLSSHGFTKNQLTLWDYPSTVKMAELTGHTSRVLFMAQSPDGCTVASAAGDETVRLWNVFGTPEIAKPKVPTTSFTSYCGFLVIKTRSLECCYVIYTYSYCGCLPCCTVYILNSDASTNVSYTCIELQYISAMFIPSVN